MLCSAACFWHIQGHATDTYDEFVQQNEEALKALPPPLCALEYYKGGDLYFFDQLQTTGTDPKRRPSCACAAQKTLLAWLVSKARPRAWLLLAPAVLLHCCAAFGALGVHHRGGNVCSRHCHAVCFHAAL